MLDDMLTLTSIQIRKVTQTPDGMGGFSSASVLTTLTKAQIWQAGSNNRYLSDKITRASTHVLAIRTGEYTFSDEDIEAYNGTEVYKITGHADDVANQGEITIVGLERLT